MNSPEDNILQHIPCIDLYQNYRKKYNSSQYHKANKYYYLTHI